MAEIKVEKRREGPWLWIALAVAALLIGLGVLMWSMQRPATAPDTLAGREDAPAQAAAPGAPALVVYEGREWVPVDVARPAQFPDEQMVRVGTHEGNELYANREAALGGGGGGGLNPPGYLETQPWGRIYVRVGENRYQPMAWRSVAEEHR